MNKLLASVLISQFYFGFADICCPEKKVGDKTYQLREEGDTTQFNCMNGCIYSLQGEDPNQRFCFRSGRLPVVCQNNDDIAGYIYHKPSQIFKMSSENIQSSSKNLNVSSWKDGFATENSGCISATAGGWVKAKYKIRRRAVSSAKIQTKAAELVRHIKEEKKKEFTHSVTNEAHGQVSIMNWLGIKFNGGTSNTNLTKDYVKGQKGLDEARKEYAEELSNNIREDVEIEVEAFVEGLGPISAKACIYFAIQQVKLTNGETLNIVISDDKTMLSADEKTGELVANKGIKGSVIDL